MKTTTYYRIYRMASQATRAPGQMLHRPLRAWFEDGVFGTEREAMDDVERQLNRSPKDTFMVRRVTETEVYRSDK